MVCWLMWFVSIVKNVQFFLWTSAYHHKFLSRVSVEVQHQCDQFYFIFSGLCILGLSRYSRLWGNLVCILLRNEHALWICQIWRNSEIMSCNKILIYWWPQSSTNTSSKRHQWHANLLIGECRHSWIYWTRMGLM
jgi:hypothetical protein